MFIIKNLKLSVEQVLNKEFKVDYQGYSPQEVDMFLDEIAEDYKIITNITDKYEQELTLLLSKIKELNKKNDILLNQNELLTKENQKLEHEGFTKADLIKRIKNLEDKLGK